MFGRWMIVGLLMVIPSFLLMIFGVIKGLAATKEEQKKIIFPVRLECETCGHCFEVPLHVYGEHFYAKSQSIRLGGGLMGTRASYNHILAESRKVHCPSCQKENYCKWLNIADFPMAYRRQITLVMLKTIAPYFIVGFVWTRLVSLFF